MPASRFPADSFVLPGMRENPILKEEREEKVKIAVCIKQVPDTTDVKINPKTNTLIREGVASITNPFDEYAVEEALRIKEKHGGEVHVISMGPPQAVEVLKNALAVGADKVYLVDSPDLADNQEDYLTHKLLDLIKEYQPEAVLAGASHEVDLAALAEKVRFVHSIGLQNVQVYVAITDMPEPDNLEIRIL